MGSYTSSIQFISDAYRLFKKERYREAALILEKIVSSSIDDPYPFFLLAVSYLHTSNFDKAEYQLKNIEKIDPHYIPMIQLRIFLQVKSAVSQDDVLRRYLDLLEKYPEDGYLQKGRTMLSYTDNFSDYQKKIKLTDLVLIPTPPTELLKLSAKMKKQSKEELKKSRKIAPKASKRGNLSLNFSWMRKVPKALIVLLPFVLLSWGAYLYFPVFLNMVQRQKTDRRVNYSRVDMVNIRGSDFDIIKKINKNKTEEFYYSSQEMTDDFYDAKRKIKNSEYNEALIKLNRINNSNASYMVKEKTNFLIEFIRDVDYRNFESIDIRTIMKKPYLYRGYAVALSGKVANKRELKESITFALLVDYRETDIFSGIVEVFSPTRDGIDNGLMVNVQGILMNPVGVEKKLYITAQKVERMP